MRSRSVSRRSAPSSSALEGSLSRMRSRSAHREQDRYSWVSPTAAPSQHQQVQRLSSKKAVTQRDLKLPAESLLYCDGQLWALYYNHYFHWTISRTALKTGREQCNVCVCMYV